jgi:plasmid stabilization system protein ParE
VSFTVEVTRRAIRDAERLDVWLMNRDPKAAARLGDLLENVIASLAEHPFRGRPLDETVRELNVPFGQGAYIIRYDVLVDLVVITRIWHGLEDRQP